MKRVFILKGLDCPNCSAKIEKEVGALPGVESSVVNGKQWCKHFGRITRTSCCRFVSCIWNAVCTVWLHGCYE